MSDTDAKDVSKLSFGEAITELDQVVAALESGSLELEESLARYERGVALLRVLQGKLADAQQKVTMLVGELEPDTEDAPVAPTPASPAVSADDGGVEIPF